MIHDRDYDLFGLLDFVFHFVCIKIHGYIFVRIGRCVGEDSS